MFAIQAIAEEANAIFISCHGFSTLVSQQCGRLVGLVETYCRMLGMVGLLDSSQLEMIDNPLRSICPFLQERTIVLRSCKRWLNVIYHLA
jgi:hypothetical protein